MTATTPTAAPAKTKPVAVPESTNPVFVTLPPNQAKLLHRLADVHVKVLQAKVKEAKTTDKLYLEIADGILLRTALMNSISLAAGGKVEKDEEPAVEQDQTDPVA